MKARLLIVVSILTFAIIGSANWIETISAGREELPSIFIGATEFNAVSDFSLTQSETSVWQYGFTPNPTSNAFDRLSTANTFSACTGSAGVDFQNWGTGISNQAHLGLNITPSTFYCGSLRVPTDAVYMHPGENGQRAVVRWTAPNSGSHQVTGAFEGLNGGYRDVKILKNGAVIDSHEFFVNGYEQRPFNFTVSVAVGDTIDFSVGWGNGTWNSDGTGLAVTIGPPATACEAAPADLRVSVPAENSAMDVQSVNTNSQLVGNATYTNAGKVGRAFDLDGSGDYVRIEDHPAQRPATALTIEAWVKFDSIAGFPHIISKPLRNSDFNSYALYLENGTLRLFVGNHSGQYTRAFSSFIPQTGVWHHVAFTYNFSAGISTLKLYANGVEVTQGGDGTPNLPLFYESNPHPLLIGGEFGGTNNTPTDFVDGQIDEVSVYGRALAGSEIADIVRQGSYGKCAASNCSQAAESLVSWFAGEKSALDSKSNNHGSLQNGVTTANGKVGQALKFDGSDDYVEIPDHASLKPANLTLETWVMFDSLTSTTGGGAPAGYQNIIFKKNSRTPGSGFEGGYSLVKNPDNRLGLGFNSASGGTDFANSTTVMQAGVWYHVAGTHDGTDIKLYVNGQLEGTGTATFPIDYGTTPLYLGSAQVPFNGSFNGVLDETSIYNRALTASEVAAVHSSGQSGKCKPAGLNPPANQTAWFTGDGDARDFANGAVTGTLHGNTEYRPGRVAQAFRFDGSGDYVSTPDSPTWDFGTGDMAIEGWINSPTPTGFQRIISAGSMADGANNLWSLGYGDGWGGGQKLNFAVFNGAGYTDFYSNALGIRPNTWHHVAVVRSATTLTFYFDGIPAGTTSIGAGFAVNGGSTGAILGARYNNNPSLIFEYANGMLDEISLYSRAVTAGEIAAVYNAGVAGKSKRRSTLVGGNLPTQLSDATVTFAAVGSPGTTSQTSIDLGNMPALPSNVTRTTGLSYDISSSAAYQTGTADAVKVCFNIPSLASIGAGGLRLLHLESGAWIDRTASGNSLASFCSDNLTSLSPFIIVEGTAPAAHGISGRITNGGIGVANVSVALTGTASSTATTNANGDYSFGNLPAGGSYTVTPTLAGYSFSPANRAYNSLSANVTDAHFAAAVIPTVSISDVTVTEGNSGSVNANFNVTLSTAYVDDVTVYYWSYDGTATSGADYLSVNTSVVFAAGETAKVVTVPVLGDTIDEENETFGVYIVSAVNATVADGDATGTINDNDEAQCVTSPSGKVAAFKGENNANDSQGTNNGTGNGGVTYATGKVGQAFNFPDGNAYVSIPDSPALRPDSFTVEGWFNFTSYANEFRMLFDKRSANTDYSSYNLFIYGGLLTAQSSDGSSLGNTLSHLLNPTPGQWYHIAFTRQAGGQMTLYVNGIAVDSQAANASVGYSNAPFTLGSTGSSPHGKIDELSIYSRDLSGAEVTSIYTAGSAGVCPTGQCFSVPADQSAWYRGENDANDSEGTNNGTINGSVTYVTGKTGQSFNFGDENASVTVPDAPALRPDSFTIEGWFNFGNYSNEFRMLFDKRTANPDYSSYNLFIYGGLLTAQSSDGISLGNSVNYGLYPVPGQWYHIAFSRQAGGQMTLYVNGVAVNSEASNASVGYANTPFTLSNAGSASQQGKIDELSIYSRALSAGDVQSIYAAGGAGKCPSGSCLTAPADLQNWYRFQNSAADVFNLRPGAAQGNATYSAGRVGQAINFDGIDDSVDFGSWFNYQTFSISMWLNLAPFSEQPTYANIIDNNHTGGTNWVMQRAANENHYVFGDNSGGGVTFIPTPNTWQHVTVTRDSSGLRLYVDGVLAEEDLTVGTIPYNGAQFLRLGRWGGGGRHLKGKIDELDIYTRVLSPSEVSSIYSAGSAGKCVPPQCADTPATQVAAFKGENNANDSQGTNNGTGNGGVTYATGKVGQAFNFPDGNAYVSIPDSPALRPDSFTIEGWFNFTSYANEFRMLFDKRSANTDYSSYNLFIYGGLLTAQSSDGSSLGNTLSHLLNPTPGQWYHIAFTRQAGGQMTLYVNGIAVDSQAANASVGYSNAPLTLGSTGSSPHGKIDELSIYSSALTSTQIQAVVDADSAGKCPTLGCAAANYEFNDNLESTGVTAPSLSYIGTGQTFATEVVNGQSERVLVYQGGNAVELRPTTGVIPSNQYEITFVTRFNQTYSYNRVLDFKDGTTDAGLYVTSGALTFYGGGGSGPPAIGPGVWVEIKVTRTATGIFKAFVNGVEQFSFNDTAGVAIISPTNALRFFKDDGGEHYGGAIANIRLSSGDDCNGGAQCAAPPADQVAWYRGNNNPLDWTTPSTNAVMENGATFALGRVSYGFSLDGVDDFVAAPASSKFDITGDISIETWVRPAQIQSGEVTLVSKRDLANSNVNYVMFLRDGELRFASRSGGGAFSDNGSGVTLSPGTFSHVAATVENGSLRFYVNGTATAPQAAPTTRSASTGRLTIGATEVSTLSGFFNGVIDEVSLYSRALSSGEVTSIFNAGAAGKCATGGNDLLYSIGGRVTDSNGVGMGNLAIALSDGPTTFGNISTDANGYYLWYNLQPNSNYTVTPTLANTTFTPPSRTYTSLSSNIANANFTAAAACTFTIDPALSEYSAAGGSGSFNITTQPGCQWTATTDASAASFVTFNGATTGTGNGTVAYSVSVNNNILRYGQLLINGNAAAHTVGQQTGSGTCPSVMPIAYGTTTKGSLASGDCSLSGRFTDQYSFSGTSGDRILIRLSSGDFPEAIILHNTSNTNIYSVSTGGAANDARVPGSFGFYTLPATGTYIISASSWGNGGSQTGAYSLTLHSDRTVPGVAAPSGLIGWYAGEGDTRNQQGAGTGTFSGGAAYAADYVGQSFNMNGVNRYVEIPAAQNAFNVSSISVEAWVKTSTLSGDQNSPSPGYRNIASKYNGTAGTASWSLDMETGGAITFYVYDGSPNTYRAVRSTGAAAMLALGEWKHVAATFDSSTQAIKLYINGADAGELVSGSAASITMGQNSAPVRIGAYQASVGMRGFWVGHLDEVSIYDRPLAYTEITSIIDAGRVGKIKQASVANQTTASVGSSTVTFPAATSGTVTETPIDNGALPAPLPPGNAPRLAFDVSTTAPFTGNATVCFAIPSIPQAEFGNLRIFHREGSNWVDRTAPGNTYPNLCAITPSFSPFVVAGPAVPTAAEVSISGRVTTASGNGIRNAIVRVTEANGNVRLARTGSLGYYSLDSIAGGQAVIVEVVSKRFSFANPVRFLTLTDSLTDVSFVATE